jgi:hypothetical protein
MTDNQSLQLLKGFDFSSKSILSRNQYIKLDNNKEYKSVNLSGSIPKDILASEVNFTSIADGMLDGEFFTYLNTENQVVISSTNTTDDNSLTLANSSARQITIVGRNNNYDQIVENVNLNGQNGVLSTNSFWRIENVSVLSTGTLNEFNAGKIYISPYNGVDPDDNLTLGKPDQILDLISINRNISDSCKLTTGIGEKLLPSDIVFSSGVNFDKPYAMEICAKVRYSLPNQPSTPWFRIVVFETSNPVYFQNVGFMGSPLITTYHEDIEIKVRISTTPGGASVSPGISLFLSGYVLRDSV